MWSEYLISIQETRQKCRPTADADRSENFR